MERAYENMIETLRHAEHVSCSDLSALLNLTLRMEKSSDDIDLEDILTKSTRRDLSEALEYVKGALHESGIERYEINNFRYHLTNALKENINKQIKAEFKKGTPEKYDHIKPVVKKGKGLSYIKDVDPKGIAFTWDPKPTKKAKDLEPYKTITTYHSWAYYGFFKPSLAEVYVQIPEEDLDKVVAFETEGDVEIVGSLHETVTTLYKRK